MSSKFVLENQAPLMESIHIIFQHMSLCSSSGFIKNVELNKYRNFQLNQFILFEKFLSIFVQMQQILLIFVLGQGFERD
jgi:uncharacterized membrane protein YozB (DUF420 family)